MGIFENYAVTTFQASGGAEIPISVERITEETEWRLIARERPFRKGAKLDNTSRKQRIWTIESLWQEGLQEDGIPASGYYPAMLNALIASFDAEQTGTLKLPTRGAVRVQCKSYRRAEVQDERDKAALSLTFWEDNEDDATAASFTQPSPVVAGPLLYADFSDAAQAIGLISDDVSSLGDLVDALTALLQLGTAIADIIGGATDVVATIASIEAVWTNQTLDVGPNVGRILSDPESWYVARLMRRLAAQAANAALMPNATNQANQTTVVRFPIEVSLFDVVARIPGQKLETLLSLNAGYGDPYAIPAQSPVVVEVV